MHLWKVPHKCFSPMSGLIRQIKKKKKWRWKVGGATFSQTTSSPPLPPPPPTSPAATHVAGFCSSRVKPQLSGFLKCQLFLAEQTHRGSDRGPAAASSLLLLLPRCVSVRGRLAVMERDSVQCKKKRKKERRGKKKSRTLHRLAGPTAWPANSFTAADG